MRKQICKKHGEAEFYGSPSGAEDEPHAPKGRRNDLLPFRLLSSSLSNRCSLAARLTSPIVPGRPASNSGSTSSTFSLSLAGREANESTRLACTSSPHMRPVPYQVGHSP
ncbi:unnamed protein product [Ectocarpus sp. 8 AP-2014]